MLTEALQYLEKLVRAAVEPREIFSTPRLKVFLVDGNEIDVDIPVPSRNHRVRSLDGLIALANRFHDASDTPVVWYSEDYVQLILDDSGHRASMVLLNLEYSDAFRTVLGLRSPQQWYDQKSFIRLLRVSLAGTLDAVHLLDIVRRLRFENGTVTSGTVTRQQESLGREITAKVSAEKEIPDFVTLEIPVYKVAGLTERLPLRCHVEVDPARGAFQLIPFPDEIERVQQMAIVGIAERLGRDLEEGIPAYYGSP
jgi:hypothetical protein